MKRCYRIAAMLAAVLMLAASVPFTALAAYENTHVNTGNQPADIVAVAKTQLGYVEGANDYNKYGAAYGMANAPWCGFFVSWCARQAGVPKAVIPDSGGATSFFSAGTYHARTSGYEPTVGDLILYGVYGDADHVGIVERFDPTTGRVYVLDGNWSDQVSSHYSLLTDTDVAGFVTPAYTSTVSEMGVFNMVVPEVIPIGGAFSVSGFVASPNTITSVNVTVSDENGTACFSQTATPNDTLYELAAMDAALKFNELPSGLYSYTVTATDTTKTKRWSYLFEVVGTIEFQLTDAVIPSKLSAGGVFCVYGTVTCSETLKTVSVEAYDTADKFMTGGSRAASGATFDLHTLDDYLAFDDLARGEYTLRITARSTNSSTVWEQPFTVGDTMEQVIVFSGTPIADSISAGQAVTLDGTVTSSHRLTNLTATVTDAAGTAVFSAQSAPAARVVSLGTLTLDTASLAAGEYTLTFTASGAYGTQTASYPFTVKAGAEFTLTGVTAPTQLSVGGVFSVYGTVTASEPLQTVALLVTDTAGAVKLRVTASPNAASYDLHKLDNDVTFNTLPEGKYIYTVKAVTASSEKQWDYPFTVGTPSETTITLSGQSYPTAIPLGGVYVVKGTVTASAKLTSVDIVIVNSAGAEAMRVSATPDATTYNLALLDNDVTFNTLPTGRYTYSIRAAAADTEKQWDYPFTVGDVEDEPPVTTSGDLNGDGTVNTMDALILYSAASGNGSLTAAQEAAADLNGDGIVNTLDALQLYKLASGA